MSPTHYIFNHIPKTAGTTLLTIFRRHLPSEQISPHLTEPAVRMLRASQFEHFRLVAGHFSLLTQAGFCKSRYTLTLLRHPVRRIFSAYTFWRTAQETNVVTLKAKELPFDEFVRYFAESPAIIDNPYTHHLAGIGRDFPCYPTDTNALLAAARANLCAFNFVGISEQFTPSLARLCIDLGWSMPDDIPHENRTFSEDKLASVDPQTMDLLLARNRLDMKLYELAVERFQTRAATAGEPNRFSAYTAPTPHRRARIESVSTRWTSLRQLELQVEYTTNAVMPELSLGVQVNDSHGNVVWGTSTANEHVPLTGEPGYAGCGAFLADCELAAGLYFVTAALSEPRRLGFHEHWLDQAAMFEVEPSRAAPASRISLRQFTQRSGHA